MENNNEPKSRKIGFFQRVRFSISKFERYPEMAADGVGKAFAYLAKLMLIFTIIVVIGGIYNLNNMAKQAIKYLDENFTKLSYENGTLDIETDDSETSTIYTEIGTLIIDTKTTDEEKIREYENSIESADLGILWLNNKVIVYSNGVEEGYYYSDILGDMGITSFEKSDLIEYFNENSLLIYIMYGITIGISMFIVYFIATLLDVVVLSIFGLITALLLKIKMRYRAVFNMSVYSLTISIILKMIYYGINIFVDFNIEYFDFMYSAIGYICLVASIFMIKSDVMKQKMVLMKIANESETKQQEKQEEDKEEPEEKPDENDSEKPEEKEKPEPKVEENGENQGSEA